MLYYAFWTCLRVIIMFACVAVTMIALASVIREPVLDPEAEVWVKDDGDDPRPAIHIRIILMLLACISWPLCFMADAKLPLYPNATERSRLVEECNSLHDELDLLDSDDRISKDLYVRLIAYNRDDQEYDDEYGHGVGRHFDVNCFYMRSRVIGIYDNYKIYIDGTEVPFDKIVLHKYSYGHSITVDDAKREIYITS